LERHIIHTFDKLHLNLRTSNVPAEEKEVVRNWYWNCHLPWWPSEASAKDLLPSAERMEAEREWNELNEKVSGMLHITITQPGHGV
jgi:hypothetical protein